MSCAACHIDSEMDLLAWDLGDPTGESVSNLAVIFPTPGNFGSMHPMKGPMTTLTLRGLDSPPFHWRGDRADLPSFNIGFATLLGGAMLGSGFDQAQRVVEPLIRAGRHVLSTA